MENKIKEAITDGRRAVHHLVVVRGDSSCATMLIVKMDKN